VLINPIVAMTRPRRHLCICGDSETISRLVEAPTNTRLLDIIDMVVGNRGSSFLKRWMAFLEEHADLRYPDAGELL